MAKSSHSTGKQIDNVDLYELRWDEICSGEVSRLNPTQN